MDICCNEESCTAFDNLSTTIDEMLEMSLKAEIIIDGDFYVHNDRWLPISELRNIPGLYAEIFSIVK